MPHTIPQANSSNTSPQQGLETLLSSAGIVPLDDTGWIEVTGPDRVRWLNGMVTNSIGDLATSGAGCYNFILNAQGRIQGDAYVFAQPDQLLVETALAQVAGLTALLDRFIIMDDVELANISPSRHGLLLAGPSAPDILRNLHLLPRAAEAPSLARIPWRGTQLSVIRAYSPLVPRFEIWASDPTVVADLTTELMNSSATPSTPAARDLLRIVEGTPLFGIDIRDRDLPQETGAARALHFSKGCYLGQEIVERIRSRGSVHRVFTGFRLHGNATSAGSSLTVEGKPVGELTSIAALSSPAPESSVQIALGYIRREALALGKPIQYDGGVAEPVTVPFEITAILGQHLTSNS